MFRRHRMNFRARKWTEEQWVDVVVWSLVAAAIILALVLPNPARAAEASTADPATILQVLTCESSFNSRAVGDDGVSRGIAQFRKETFYEFVAMAKHAGEWDNHLGKPSWLNPQQQVFLLAWGIANGYGNRWTCYRMLQENKREN